MPLGFSRIIPSFGGVQPSSARQPPAPSSSAPAASQRRTLGGKGVIGGGKEKHGMGGKGLGKGGLKRHRYVGASCLRPALHIADIHGWEGPLPYQSEEGGACSFANTYAPHRKVIRDSVRGISESHSFRSKEQRWLTSNATIAKGDIRYTNPATV